MAKYYKKVKRLFGFVYKQGVFNAVKILVLRVMYKKNLRKADDAFLNGDWRKAERYYQAVVKGKRRFTPPNVWVNYIRSLRKQRKYVEAEKIARNSLTYWPNKTGLLTELAETTMDMKDWDKAIGNWEKLMDVSGKTEIGASIRLSRANRNAFHIEEAETAIDKALAVYPEDIGLNEEKAELAMQKKDWDESIKRWGFVIDVTDHDASKKYTNFIAWLGLSQSLRYSGRYNEAEDSVKKGLSKYPDSARLRNEYAKIPMDKNHLHEAYSRWEKIADDINKDTTPDEFAGSYPARFNVSVLSRVFDIENYKKQIKRYKTKKSKAVKKPRIVIYTAISNNYDSLKLPGKLDPEFDYIVYTDTALPDVGIFDIRPMPYLHIDKTRSARFVKTHPHILLSEYDIAIWVDANIMILDDFQSLIDDLVNSQKAFAAIPHPVRNTVYEEFEACLDKGKDEKQIMTGQLKKYGDENFNGKNLIESNFMIFNLKDERIEAFLNKWWSEIDRNSKRDQISLPYAIAKTGVEWYRLFDKPDSIRNHTSFVLTPHNFDDRTLSVLYDKLDSDLFDPFEGDSYAKVKEERMSKQNSRKIDIVVCVHNALEDVKLCLSSVQRCRKSKNQRLIIIDDGSDEPTKEFLESFTENKAWVNLIRNKRTGGYTKAANKGLRASSRDLTILLNSDAIVTDGWAEKMADAVFSTPGAGIVGPLSSAASHQSIPNHISSKDQTATNELPEGVTAEDMNRYCEEWSVARLIPRVPLMHGFCFGITRETIQTIGFFDERNFPRGYGEESDYCFRATDKGIGLVVATHTYVFHSKSKSYIGPKRVELMKKGNETVGKIYGAERVKRAILSMQSNKILVHMREKAKSIELVSGGSDD